MSTLIVSTPIVSTLTNPALLPNIAAAIERGADPDRMTGLWYVCPNSKALFILAANGMDNKNTVHFSRTEREEQILAELALAYDRSGSFGARAKADERLLISVPAKNRHFDSNYGFGFAGVAGLADTPYLASRCEGCGVYGATDEANGEKMCVACADAVRAESANNPVVAFPKTERRLLAWALFQIAKNGLDVAPCPDFTADEAADEAAQVLECYTEDGSHITFFECEDGMQRLDVYRDGQMVWGMVLTMEVIANPADPSDHDPMGDFPGKNL